MKTPAQWAHLPGEASQVLAVLVAVASQVQVLFPKSPTVLTVCGVVFAVAKIASTAGVAVQLPPTPPKVTP